MTTELQRRTINQLYPPSMRKRIPGSTGPTRWPVRLLDATTDAPRLAYLLTLARQYLSAEAIEQRAARNDGRAILPGGQA